MADDTYRRYHAGAYPSDKDIETIAASPKVEKEYKRFAAGQMGAGNKIPSRREYAKEWGKQNPQDKIFK